MTAMSTNSLAWMPFALALVSIPAPARAVQEPPAAPPAAPPPAPIDEPRGLILNEPGAFDGLTIIEPLRSKEVHLVDMAGKVVHTWKCAYPPGAWLHLLPNGNLLRGGHKEDQARFHGGGIGGVIQELDWDGNVVWEFELATEERRLHHDFEPLPNGNLLAIAWEYHSKEESIAHGRDAAKAEDVGLWPDVLVELKPIRPRGAEIVWTWRAWDHLVQDRDPAKPGYGSLRDFPGRIDVNADHRYEKKEETPEEKKKREDLEGQMKKLGYTGGDAPPDGKDAPKDGPDGGKPPEPPKPSGDFMHTNAVDYLPEEDLIVLSSPHLCELFVIDHGTTTKEAAGNTGGRRGHGGELLWRWGNPQNYGMGTEADRRNFYQHDPSWLPGSRVGELHLLFFNNGMKRAPKEFSVVEEIVLPFVGEKGFVRAANEPFGPKETVWSYSDPDHFVSQFISGAQRMPNGNTLICEGKTGRVFEVTKDGKVVWDYRNPLGGELEPSPQGGKAPPHALFRAVRIPRNHPALKGRI